MIDFGSMAGVMGGGMALGVIAACWGHIKGFIDRAMGLMIIRVEVESWARTAVSMMCWREFKSSKGAFRKFHGEIINVKPLARQQVVGFEGFPAKAVLFWDGWRPIIVSSPTDKDSGNEKTTMTFIRGTFKVEALMERAFAGLNARMQGAGTETYGGRRFTVKRCVGKGNRKIMSSRDDDDDGPGLHRHRSRGSSDLILENRPVAWRPEELGAEDAPDQPFGHLALSPDMELAIEEARHWMKSKQWYKERQIPWRRGWLLHGKPGTGKTSVVKALAQELDLPVYIMDIASMNNQEFINFWTEALAQSPAVVLIEDIDAVYHGRENTLGESGGGLTFDCILNAISGVEGAEGMFTVITTNHIEYVDEALAAKTPDGSMSSRPGRIDRTIELGALARAGRVKIASRILSCCPDLIDQVILEGDGDTGAQFQERCSTLALEQFWLGVDSKG